MAAEPCKLTPLEALEIVTRDYASFYNYRPDEDGPVGVLDEQERDMLLDAINGLVAEPAFIEAFELWRSAAGGGVNPACSVGDLRWGLVASEAA